VPRRLHVLFPVVFMSSHCTAVRPSLQLTLGSPWAERAEVAVGAPPSSYLLSAVSFQFTAIAITNSYLLPFQIQEQ
jgi:hypothetical protein